MGQTPPAHEPHTHDSKRPKGILKNSSSYTSPSPQQTLHPDPQEPRPGLEREVSEKEITLQNTIQNAGPHRRSSSNPRIPSRRQSGTGSSYGDEENETRLKWDEANLYLTEQQRDSTMKITEPKTPYAKQYDPIEDEAEIEAIDASELVVDELDAATHKKKPFTKMNEIPGLDIGEPEMDASGSGHTLESEKRVMVDPEKQVEDVGHHGEDTEDMSVEEREKHIQFEAMRKKHYEMKNVKNLLGHPDEAEENEEEPPLPQQTNAMDTT